MVELIPKQARKILPLQNIFSYAALAALVLAVAAYIALFFSVSRASVSLKNLEDEIGQRGTPEEKQLERDVFDAEARIGFFAQILDKHRRPSRLLPVLEANTHPRAWFNFFDMDTETGLLELRGETLNFQSLGQQFNAFSAEILIKDIRLSALSIGKEGQIEFTLMMSFDPQIFK